MLDNLKLGYGGTAAEMYRLMRKAAELDEQFRATAQFSIDSKGHLTASFADITQAIHIVQKDLGIMGTTSAEAGSTISGSAQMMKSSWENLVTGMANENKSFTNLVIQFVSSVETFADNLLPRVEIALGGVVKLIEKLAPKIVERLPGLVESVLPSLINAAVSLVNAVAEVLPGLVETVVPVAIDAAIKLIDAVIEVLPSLTLTLIDVLADALVTNIPQLIPTVADVVVKLAMMLTDPTTLVNIINASLQIILALANGIIDNLPKLIEAVPVIITNLVTAIVDSFPMIVNTALLLTGKLVEGIVKSTAKIIEAGTGLVIDLVSGIVKAFGKLVETGVNIVTNVKSGFSGQVAQAKTWGKDLIDNFISGIKQKWENLKKTVSDVAQSVKDFLGFSEPKLGPLSNFHTYAPDMMDLFAQGIRDNEHVVTDQIAKSFDFGQRTIDFASSAQGKSSAAMIHGMMLSDQSEPKSYVAELYLDGEKVAESTYKPTKKIQKREGEPALA